MKMPQSTLIYAHVRREFVEAGASLEVLLADVNEKIREHGGIILANRQILRRPIELDWAVQGHLDDSTTTFFEHLELEWGEAQRLYFGDLWGVPKPYQYCLERDQYDQFCVSARDPTPYLVPGELIHAIVEAVEEYRCIECPCHHTQIVYTSRHRLLCMGCGQLYRVLAGPLDHSFNVGISSDRWESAFDDHGELIDDELNVPTLDYRSIERAPYIWSTDVWDEATWLIDFYAEGNKDEIRRYEATLPKAEDLISAGWTQIHTPPSLTAQLADDGVFVDLWDNSGAAVRAAASGFAKSRIQPEVLRDTVLAAFQSIELLLKMRLEPIDPAALRENNPTILRKLIDAGIAISDPEIKMINELRSLRNKLQHAGATFGYRHTRRMLRAAFTFIDRFTLEELDIWLNHVCDPQGWGALLQIAPIQANAERMSTKFAAQAEVDPAVMVADCEACRRHTMVLFSDVYGDCLYCRAERRGII